MSTRTSAISPPRTAMLRQSTACTKCTINTPNAIFQVFSLDLGIGTLHKESFIHECIQPTTIDQNNKQPAHASPVPQRWYSKRTQIWGCGGRRGRWGASLYRCRSEQYRVVTWIHSYGLNDLCCKRKRQSRQGGGMGSGGWFERMFSEQKDIKFKANSRTVASRASVKTRNSCIKARRLHCCLGRRYVAASLAQEYILLSVYSRLRFGRRRHEGSRVADASQDLYSLCRTPSIRSCFFPTV